MSEASWWVQFILLCVKGLENVMDFMLIFHDYYDFSFNRNGEYARWSANISYSEYLQYQYLSPNNDEPMASEEHLLTPTYLYTSITCVALFPLVWVLVNLCVFKRPFFFCQVNNLNIKLEQKWKLHYVLLSIFAFPIDYVFAVIWVYFLIPVGGIKFIFKLATPREDVYENVDNISNAYKVIDSVGMSLPQMIIGSVFMANNLGFLEATSGDNPTSALVPTLYLIIIQQVASGINLLRGIVAGIQKWRKNEGFSRKLITWRFND